MVFIQIPNEHVSKLLSNSLISEGTSRTLQLVQERIQRTTHTWALRMVKETC